LILINFAFSGTLTTGNMRQYDVRRKGRPANFHAEQSIDQRKVHFLGGWIGTGMAVPYKEYDGRMTARKYLRYVLHIMLRDLLTQKCSHKKTVTDFG
jgi:hypothetical protein